MKKYLWLKGYRSKSRKEKWKWGKHIDALLARSPKRGWKPGPFHQIPMLPGIHRSMRIRPWLILVKVNFKNRPMGKKRKKRDRVDRDEFEEDALIGLSTAKKKRRV